MSGRIAIAGAVAQKPHQAGHTWQFLQYLLGFQRLGYDVLFLDRLEPEMCPTADGEPGPVEGSRQLTYFTDVMERFGLEGKYSLATDGGARTFGLDRDAVLPRLKGSLLLLNVMGFLEDPGLLAAAPRRVFLDTDPGYGQIWLELGLADIFAGHDDLVTIAENIGQPGCELPTCGRTWITTAQPVLLSEWTAEAPRGGRFTAIGSWRGPYGPLEWGGKTYGLRVHEFRKFMELPRRVPETEFELALEIDPADAKDHDALVENGWRIRDPDPVGHTPDLYREYIRDSLAEFMVARGMYVTAQNGWFSERSMCYLASGRPVLAQDTGLADLYPVGEGLVTFSTLDEAAAGAESIVRDHERHARAARAVAEEFFDSDRVLPRLLERLGVETGATVLR